MAEHEEDPEKQRLLDAHAKRKGKPISSSVAGRGTVPESITLTVNP